MRVASPFIILLLLFAAVAAAADIPKIIFDSDMSSDHDDAADLAVLNALADLGECEILACMASSQNGATAVGFNAINTYYGRPNVPCGRRPDCGGPGEYPGTIISEFPHPLYATYLDPPLCLDLYRQVLAAAPDHSVSIVTTGYLNNLQALMASGPDAASPLNGMDLIRQKVKLLACAGGCYPEGDEFNFRVESQAAYDVINNWPVQAFFDGYDVGQDIYSGGRLQSTPTTNPIRRCFELTFFGAYPTWGQLMIYYAVRTPESQSLWQYNTTGHNSCFDHGDGNKGHNKWVTDRDPSGAQEQGYMIEIQRAPIQQAIDTLVMNSGAPRSKGTIAAPNPPSNLRAITVSGSRIDLQWTDNAWNETGFTVERRSGGGAFAVVASVGAGVTTWSDTGLSGTANVAYRVKAVNAIGGSDYVATVVYSGWTEANLQFPADHTPLYNYYQNNLNWMGGRAPVAHRVVNNDSAHGQDLTINLTVGADSNYGDLYVYFLYQDANNWYRLSAGQRPENSSKVSRFEKCVNGTITQIGASGEPENIGVGACMHTWQVSVSHSGSLTFLSNNNPTGNPNPTLHTVLSVSDTLAFTGGLVALGANYSAPVWDNVSFDIGSGGGPVAPAITRQPASLTVAPGQTASFTVAASGTAPLTYQWKQGATALGGNSATLSIANAQAANAGSYTCTVSNSAGSVTSNAATLTVSSAAVAPAITGQPASVTVTAGQTAAFTVTASGTAPLTYQWKQGATAVGGNSATLSIANAQAANAGSYTCTVSNSAGSATSSAATLTVNPGGTLDPLIPWVVVVSDAGGGYGGSGNTADKAFDADTSTFYDPTAADAWTGVDVGTGKTGTVTAIRYWARSGWASRMIGGVFEGSNSPTGGWVALGTVATASDTAWTTLAVSGAAGYRYLRYHPAAGGWCNVAEIEFRGSLNTTAPVAPAITTQPANLTVTAGQAATFTVAASGTGPLTWQWKRGATVVGGNSATLTIASAQAADAGSYTCTVSNSAGSATSNAATLTVNTAAVAPTITTQPVGSSVNAGQAASFTVAASGTGPLTYQWKRGATVVGGNSATLTIANAQAADAGSYTCTVSNSVGSATSTAATLTVNTASLDAIIPWTTIISDGGGGWGGSGNTADKAFDGNAATFYDAAAGDAAFTGIDVGAGKTGTVTAIRYQARSGWAGRMLGGTFEGSNASGSGYVVLATVATASDSAWTTVSVSGATPWRYLRYRGPAGGWCNVAEIEFHGSTSGGTSGWTGVDIGGPGVPGSTSSANGVISVTGSGADIWGAADAFQFAAQPLSGDGSIVAHVLSQQNTDPWAKAGVMIREGTAAGAKHAFCCVTPGNGVAFQRRAATSGGTSHTAGSLSHAPRWLRLDRAGSTLTAWESADGAAWTLVGSASIAMGDPVQIGLAVTSHTNAAACTATFDQVTVTPSGGG